MQANPESFLRARRHDVKDILSRDNIFYTPQAAEWDSAARQNLESELARLNYRLQIDEEGETAGSGSRTSAPKPAVVRASVAKKMRSADQELPASEERPSVTSLRGASDSEEAAELDEDFSTTSTLESVGELIEEGLRKKRAER